MDVFVIPIGSERYELYCEVVESPAAAGELPATGIIGGLRQRFTLMLRAAETREQAPAESGSSGWLARLQDRLLGWVSKRIVEQRLLWHMRLQTEATAVHPEDLNFDDAIAVVRRVLRRDYERHRWWLVVNTVCVVVTGPGLFFVPGPNLVAYYFAFRVVGHWLSMRGATQGLRHVTWTGSSCAPLSELRRASVLNPEERDRRVHDIAARLCLPHLPTFVERMAMTRA